MQKVYLWKTLHLRCPDRSPGKHRQVEWLKMKN